MTYVPVTCPTCGLTRTQTQCNNCHAVIPDADVATVAVMVMEPGDSTPRFLCATCKTQPLTMSTLGA